MNLEKRFNELHSFLEEHIELINFEPLEHYETQLPLYKDWVDCLSKLSDEEKINFHNSNSISFKNMNFDNFTNKISSLLNINSISNDLHDIPIRYLQNINIKKRYEIQRILTYKKVQNARSFIDIGSGAGHLSTCLLIDNQRSSVCIDASEDYQKIGKSKLKRIDPEILDRIEFKTELVSPQTKLPKDDNAMILGLHSCGDLSVDIIELFLNSSQHSLLNFGCCYHKLTNNSSPLSSIAKKKNLMFSSHALTMAAKIKPENNESYKKKIKVKNYRYALYFYLRSNFQKNFEGIGNAKSSDYELDFPEYVKKFSKVQLHEENKMLSDFYNHPKTKEFTTTIINLGLIRGKLAKLVEIYIILDRVLYLKERGCKVEIEEFFDDRISPRNLLIYAEK